MTELEGSVDFTKHFALRNTHDRELRGSWPTMTIPRSEKTRGSTYSSSTLSSAMCLREISRCHRYGVGCKSWA